MTLCVIPARGGSKRIPRKNVRTFCGRPMIAWPIGTALKSGCFSRVVVSTDDPEIAEVARGAGAEVPFLRPADLSDDHTATRPVIAHAVETLESEGAVCCLYATAPFVSPDDLRRGRKTLESSGVTYAFPVARFPSPIQRALRMGPGNAVEMMQPEHFGTRSQDLEEAWHDAGQFYWGNAQTWLKDAPIFGAGAVGIPVPRTRVQDIDSEEDWQFAELLFRTQGLDR